MTVDVDVYDENSEKVCDVITAVKIQYKTNDELIFNQNGDNGICLWAE